VLAFKSVDCRSSVVQKGGGVCRTSFPIGYAKNLERPAALQV
jgi:hypothetical protein